MATIYDVAKRAGVSPKTVSRVLNGDAPVGRETRTAVEQAIADLGYVPSNAARMMRSNRSGLIGLITGAISQSPHIDEPKGLPDLYIVQGVQSTIAQSGKTLMIADTGGRFDRVAPLLQTFLQHRVEGLIYVADYHQEVALPSLPKDSPLVLANCFDRIGTPSVLPDDRKGQQMLVERIIKAGHQRIGYLTLPRNMCATKLRTEGYKAALASAGIAFDPSLVLPAYAESQGQNSQLLWDAIDRLLSLDVPPTVLCCGNDEMAMRVYGILRTRGIRVPEEMSIAGYDNHVSIAKTLFPPLSTVGLPYAAMGVRAAERLLSLIDSETPQSSDPTLVSGPISWRSSVTEQSTLHYLKSKGRTTQ